MASDGENYHFKADIKFEADSMEDAVKKLSAHFDKMLLLFSLVGTSNFTEDGGWFDGRIELSDDTGETIICEGG